MHRKFIAEAADA